MNEDYSPELADAVALVTFGRGSCVEPSGDGFVVARYVREWNEAVRPAGSCERRILGHGLTRRAAIEDSTDRRNAQRHASGGAHASHP